ncbi:MAG TPA: hypothetical protein DHV51_01620 [Opitutae bacterium]|nr:hypothetical protein [Opitutae bacterium]
MISIITPSFNGEKFLRNCIESVLQACDGLEFEHIVVDGASTDGTLDILKKYPHVRWISEKDNGMYDAINKGIRMATGLYIGHLNSDEQYNREGLQKAIQKLREKRADAVFSPTIMINGRFEFLQLFNQVVVPRVEDTHWCMPVQSCSLLYKRSIWERYPYNAQYRFAGDHDFFRQQMERGLSIVSSRTPIGIFTWHRENLSSSQKEAFARENVLADIDKKSLRIKWIKHVYRIKKLFMGAYIRKPLSYSYFQDGVLLDKHIPKPRLKLSRQEFETLL